MTASRGLRAALASVVAIALIAAAGCAGAPGWLRDAPDPFAFPPASGQIPGALVQSQGVRITGLLNRRPTTAYADGAAEELIVNGKPMGRQARVRAGSRIAVAVRAPDGYGETAVGRVWVNGTEAEFRVSTVAKPPARRLALGATRTAPGKTAKSRLVAPTGFAPGAMLEVSAPMAVQVETRTGRTPLPARLRPGEPFRLVARMPERWSEPLELRVRLGALEDIWRISPAEPPPASG